MSDSLDPRFLRGARAGEGVGVPRPPEALPRAGYTGAREVAYKRRAVKPSRKRRGPVMRWLRPLGTALLLVGVPVAVAWWLLTAPPFALQRLDVVVAGADGGTEGDPRLVAWVTERLAPLQGENLVRLSLERVPRAVGEHRWIERLETGKRLPDELRVVIHRHRPRALLERSDGPWWATGGGVAIAPVTPGDPWAPEDTGGLPTVTGAQEAAQVTAALAVAAELASAQPGWGADGVLDRIEVLSEDDFRIHTTALSFPLILRRGEVAQRVEWLKTVLPPLTARWGEPVAVDLRFARRIVVERGVDVERRRISDRSRIQRRERSPEAGA